MTVAMKDAPAVAGHTYRWSRNSNGTFNIFDVEVFAEHSRDLGMKLVESKDGQVELAQNVIEIDKPWLQASCDKNKARFAQDNYCGPLKVYHKEGGLSRPIPAGSFLLKEVRESKYEGKPVSILYADFIKIPAAIFEQIKAGLLPYRSVEISDISAKEIDGISLLDTDTPFFRFPNLLPGTEVFGAYYKVVDESTAAYTRAFVKGGDGARAVLCYFAGKGQYEEKKDDPKSKSKPKPDGEVDPSDELGGEDDEDMEDSMSEKLVAAIENMTAKFDVVLSTLQRVIGTAVPPKKTDPDGVVKEEGGKVQAQAEIEARYEARIAAAEGKLKAIDSEKELAVKVDAALGRLTMYNLGVDAREKLMAKSKGSADPDKVIEAYESTVKQFGVQMPGAWDPTKGAVGAEAGHLPEVLEYKADAAQFQKAIKLADAYKWNREHNVIASGMTLKDFLKYNLTDLKTLVTA